MKKLLILGGNPTEIEIVNRAQQLGYYVIVTDNHEDWTLSPAKQIANEGWNISWSDVDTLEKKCIENGVDGVLAGFSEFRVDCMIKLCERLSLPCSLTSHQLEVTRNKVLFKDTCRKYGIPTVPEYSFDEVCRFPVIVKPVDRAGSIGINVATNHEELKSFYEEALNLSPSKHVIIEDFITDGVKIDVYYYVRDHQVTFLGSSDTIMCKGEAGAKILQKCWPFRSKFEDEYRSGTERNVIGMFEGLNINNAYATMSAFYRNGKFYFFEAGFRLSGEMSFNYQEALSGLNYINTMIRFSLNENTEEKYNDIDGRQKYSIVLNFFVLDGIVGEIIGADKLSRWNIVKSFILYVKIGDVVRNSTNVFKKGAMVTIVCDSQKELIEAVESVNTIFDIVSVSKQSLIYERVTRMELNDYYRSKEPWV